MFRWLTGFVCVILFTATVRADELPRGHRYVRGAWSGGDISVTVYAPDIGGGYRGPLLADWL